MPYLICNECEIYYEIDSDFNINDLNNCEKCGRGLKYYHNFDEYYGKNDSNTKVDTDVNDYSMANKHSNYYKIAITGFILAIIGLFLFILAYIWPLFILPRFQNPNTALNSVIQIILMYFMSFVLMVSGVLIYIYSKRKENREITQKAGQRGIYKRNIYKNRNQAADYFQKLPEGYFVLNNLRIPSRKIKIDRVVIGPTGIFLIHIKNLHGHHIINDNEWMNNKSKITAKSMGNPSRQVKLNAIELKRFLESKNLNIDYILINSIVAFTHRNFTVRKMPKTYSVMHVEEMPGYIADSKTKMDMGTVTEAVVLLEHYSGGVVRS